MGNLRKFLRESRTRYLQLFASKRVAVNIDRAIISITFDDVPLSALENGVPLLDRFNIKGTFYVAMGLANSEKNHARQAEPDAEVYLDPKDIRMLHLQGHHIACHTYSHYMLDTGSADELERDAIRNIDELKDLLGHIPIDHFSYPFGQVNFKAKKLLSKHYKTMRCSRPGINSSPADLYLLRASSIYSREFNQEDIKGLIKTVERHRGWLIFYTHGVTEQPDAYSCTPEQLEWVIEQCNQSSAEILTVSEAFERVTSHQPIAS